MKSFHPIFLALIVVCFGQIPQDEIADLVDQIDASKVYKILETTYEVKDFFKLDTPYNLTELSKQRQQELEKFHREYVNKQISEDKKKLLNGPITTKETTESSSRRTTSN